MQGYWLIACFFNKAKGIIDATVCRITLGRCSKIYTSLSKGYAGLGPSYFHNSIEGSISQQQGIRVCKTDILGSTDDKAAGYN